MRVKEIHRKSEFSLQRPKHNDSVLRNEDTERERLGEDGEDAPTNQGMSRTASSHWKLGERHEFPGSLQLGPHVILWMQEGKHD